MKIPTTLDRRNNKLRLFTFALAVWLLIAAMPISSFAELLELDTQPVEDQTVYVLAEDTTKRSEFEKHYYCSDGTFVAVTYPEAVHYKDENGEWVDVDMRLAGDASAASYEGQSGDFKTVFRTPAASGDVSVMANGVSAAAPAVSMQSGEYTLSWSLTGTKAAASTGTSTYALNQTADGGETIMSVSADTQIQVLGEIKTAEAALSVQKIPVTDPDAFALPAASNQVMYEDVFGTEQNVSVRYSVSLNKIEEDILITAATEMTSFSMQIECGELMSVLNDDNSVDFVDELGNMVYHVSTPYLADAAFAVSYDVSVTLTQQDGVCTITYTPDAEWMNAPDRVYPIMLDPAVITNEYTYAINDTYVVEGDDTCYYTNQYLLISQSDGKGRAAIIRFSTLPEIDPSMPIISAKLSLSTYIGPNGVDLKLESMESGFNFLMNKYSDWKMWNRTEIDRATYSTGTSVFEFDMTSCITDLYTGNISPDFSVSLYDEDSTTYVSAIHSADTAFGDYYRPCLTITYGYNLPTGLAVGDKITIQNLSSGGYLYPYSALIGNGNPVLHTPAATSSDNYRLLTLRKNTTNGTYRLEYTPSSSSTGAYISADTTTNKVVMYNTTNVPSNIKQDWLIVPDSVNTFKIVLASDMSYVMTAVGDAVEGYVSIALPSNLSIGNQSWLIYKDGAPIYGLAMTSSPLPTGIYYVNNRETGRFISYNDTFGSLSSISGKVADIGEMIAWKITKLPDGYYTIQNADNLDEFLTVLLGTVTTASLSSDMIPSAYKWRIEATSKYFYIKNVGANKYLYANTDDSSSSALGVQAGNTVAVSKWNIISEASYVELETADFEEVYIVEGEESTPHLESVYPSNARLAESINDFTFRISSSTSTVVLEGNEISARNVIGETEITAIHKATSQEFVFDVHSVPAFASELTTTGIVDYNHIVCTDDGLYMLNVPLSEVFFAHNIDQITHITDNGIQTIIDIYPVNNFYDDWYLYAIESEGHYTYSLLKMREQESDYSEINGIEQADGDHPGVSVSFIEFDVNDLFLLINSPTDQNQELCYQSINTTISPSTAVEMESNDTLINYFSNYELFGSYLIAEQYIKKILSTSMVDNIIPLPDIYSNLEPGIKSVVYTHYDLNDEIVVDNHICLPEGSTFESLTSNEKNIILLTHTGVISINGFAAEIEVHADAHFVPGVRSIFDGNIIVADLTVAGNHDKEFAVGLYSEAGVLGYLQKHIKYHGREPI